MWSALAPMAWGASLVIAENPAPAALVAALDEQRIGYAALVPALLAPMVDVPGAADRAYPTLRLLHTGSAPATARTLRRATGVFRCALVQGYGLTETAAAVSTMTPADTALALCARPELLGSVGRALRGTQIRVVDAGGRPGAGGHRRRGRGARAAADDRLRRAPGRDARRPAPRVAAHRRRRATSIPRATCTSRTG